jgi:hypothetical protein
LDQARSVHAKLLEQILELASRIVITHTPDEIAPGTERHEIGRHVSGAAGAHPFLFNLNDGYRSLR